MIHYGRPSTTLAAPVLVALLLAATPGEAQPLPQDPAERARVIAQIVQANARQLTVVDRAGKVVSVVGTRDMYSQPALSPDGRRLAVIKTDLDKESDDLWIMDVAAGTPIRITSNQSRDRSRSPVWSPDGTQVAYAALRTGFFGVYRKAANGDGTEEVLYRSNGPVILTDWTIDGRFLTFFSTTLAGGTLFALPLDASGERKAIELYRSESQLQGPHLSPDNRFFAYVSNESGRNEVYVRRFDPTGSAGAGTSAGPWRVSNQGGQGMTSWRRDGKELYFLSADRSVMSVPVNTSTNFEFGPPKMLFRPPEATPVIPGMASLSRDGERAVFAVPLPQARQITMLDRQGRIVGTAGQPGVYVQPGVSPDGTRVVVMRNDPRTSNQDISTIDLSTGRATAITNDMPPENAPIWAPDSRHVAYVSTRGNYAGIYRKAADGTGDEELLFRYTPGAGMVLTDWSRDGKFLVFHAGALLIVPLRADEKPLERKAIEWLRADYDAAQGRFSPDSRYLAYLSNEADGEKMQVMVRPFNADKPDAPPSGEAVQVSTAGALGMIFWRQDGRELYFLNRDWEVMAVEVTTAPAFEARPPKVLFKLPGPLVGNPMQWKNVTADGQRFIFAMPAPASPSTR